MGDDDIETTDNAEIDLRDRLRFAAGSLAADFSDELTVDLAEELVFNSAEGLLAAASVTEFVPILAERRARQVFRAGAATLPVADPGTGVHNPPADPPSAATPAGPPDPPPPVGAPPTSPPLATAPPTNGVAPLLAVAESELTRLRDEVERARRRVTEWRSHLTRR
jgi:hypothetical protein